MEHLYLKQKVFSLTEKFTFYDLEQNEVIKARGSFFSLPKHYTLVDEGGQAVLLVERTIFSLMPEFTLFTLPQRTEICRIRKRFRIGSPRLDIFVSNTKYLIEGSFFAHEFFVRDEQGNLLISVCKKWLAWGDTYEISINTSLIEKHVAAGIVLAIDCTYHSNNNKSW